MFEVSRNLIESCFEKYKNVKILEPNKYVESVPVENGNFDSVKTYTKEALYFPLAESEMEKLNYKIVLPQSVDAPIEKDTEIGNYKVYFDNNLILCSKIYTMEDVMTKDYVQKIKDIIENWS